MSNDEWWMSLRSGIFKIDRLPLFDPPAADQSTFVIH